MLIFNSIGETPLAQSDLLQAMFVTNENLKQK